MVILKVYKPWYVPTPMVFLIQLVYSATEIMIKCLGVLLYFLSGRCQDGTFWLEVNLYETAVQTFTGCDWVSVTRWVTNRDAEDKPLCSVIGSLLLMAL